MIAVISDVHGNAPALRAVLADIEREAGSVPILSLGDVAGYYSQINECVATLRAHRVINLLGNHDDYLVSDGACPRSGAANECIALQKRVSTPDTLRWIAGSARRLVLGEASLVHGGWDDPVDEYVLRVAEPYFARFPESFFFSGHSHVQVLAPLAGGRFYCNPGSVGQPRDGDWRAAYALFDPRSGTVRLRRVEYDVEETAQAMRVAGFDSYFFENLFRGTRIGGKTSAISLL